MKLVEVTDKTTRKEFLDLPRKLYRNDPNWVCPLDKDIEQVFDSAKNLFFKHGQCTRWILQDDRGETIGRIAAFINEKKAYLPELPTGGCGFFECIDSQQAADLLFNVAKNWLTERGMKAMIGPVNFGENDMWWGLLVEGFQMPFYGMNYHLPYYKRLFEQYGFVAQMEQLSNKIDLFRPFPERFFKIARWVSQKPGYSFEHLQANNLRKYADDFVEIYNDAWKHHENFTPITVETIYATFETLKPVMDENLIWFSYIKGEPASVVVIIPDVNELIRDIHGKLDLIGKLKFAYNKYIRKNRRMRAIMLGTKQRFQNHGLESAMIMKLGEYVLPKNQYRELELSWVGDFNDKMIALHQATGATLSTRHITYQYTFQ